MVGKLYQIMAEPINTPFSCLRYQNISCSRGDNILVLDVRVSDPSHGWKDVEVFINGRVGIFKIWAFKDLIKDGSLKLVN